MFMPESPRWLLRNGRNEEALRAIQRVKGVPYDSQDAAAQQMYQEQIDAVSYEMEVGKAGWLDCFKGKNKTRYRTFLGMTLQALQQLTGAN
jgi:SP family sugar:H+ symporter-like MFS transporter